MLLKIITILLSIALAGCSSTIYNKLPDKKTNLVKQNAIKTSIFYYYIHPGSLAQSAAVVEGTFVWKDGCIYLVGKDGVYSTAMFPLYPKGIVDWDEENKILSLNGYTYKMGDSISTNGQYSDYIPNSPIGIEYMRQGDKKCLNPTLAHIGTIGIGN